MVPSSTPRLRRAQPEDAQGIAQAHIESWQAAYRELMPPEVVASHSVQSRTAQWLQWLEDPGQKSIWVVEYNREIQGFVAGGPTRGKWIEYCPGEIYALYLRPACFGQGLGAQLFRHMQADLVAQGFASQWVWVLTDNAPARRFYEKMGGVYQTDTVIEIGHPPQSFAEVAYGFGSLL